jgi:hypothetical protein
MIKRDLLYKNLKIFVSVSESKRKRLACDKIAIQGFFFCQSDRKRLACDKVAIGWSFASTVF